MKQHNVTGQTHQWLTAAQMSSSAWSFAFELIQPGKKPEVQFFGASTLAVKVARFWHEVPDDQYQELRNRILQLMMAYRYTLPLPKPCDFKSGLLLYPSTMSKSKALFQFKIVLSIS